MLICCGHALESGAVLKVWYTGVLLCDRVNIGEQAIKVAQNLPAGYLSCELTGPGRAVCYRSVTLQYGSMLLACWLSGDLSQGVILTD